MEVNTECTTNQRACMGLDLDPIHICSRCTALSSSKSLVPAFGSPFFSWLVLLGLSGGYALSPAVTF